MAAFIMLQCLPGQVLLTRTRRSSIILIVIAVSLFVSITIRECLSGINEKSTLRKGPMAYDPDLELIRLSGDKPRLLFYPSSGSHLGPLLGMDYDVFVFADKSPSTGEGRRRFYSEVKRNAPNITLHASTKRTRVFRFGSKWGFLFFQENNDVLERIKASGNSIACFIGINDGCREGGNYECVNEPKFFSKVLSCAEPDGMTYVTDHTDVLRKKSLYPDVDFFNKRAPGFYKEFIWDDKYFRCQSISADFRGYSPSPSDIISEYKIIRLVPEVYEYQGPSARLTIEHDSIINHLVDLNGVVISPRCKHLIERLKPEFAHSIKLETVGDYFFRPSKRGNTGSGSSLKQLLQIGIDKNWGVIGTTAFGEGNHIDFFKVVDGWNEGLPRWIRIFHFDMNDFSDIKSNLRKI